MAKSYSQLTLNERKEIEAGLNRADSYRKIARLIGCQPSTISREVRENRHLRAFKVKKGQCRNKNWCKKVEVCSECVREGAFCAGCDVKDCRDYCLEYASHTECDILTRAPWVCNGCRKNHYGCHRPNRYIYDAQTAQKESEQRRSNSRLGIDMSQEKADIALMYIKDGLSRGLSPYEISMLYEDKVGVHRSTIYRWVEAGYGDLTNLELERKVGLKPRNKKLPRRSTSHSKKRRYSEFEKLSDELKKTRTELDSVVGRSVDSRSVLTLYNLPCHVQLALLVDAHSCTSVKNAIDKIKSVMPTEMFDKWMRIVLTDNGSEFIDEDNLGRLLGEKATTSTNLVHLYYCDPRQSQQKGSCEKNHTEIRQILEKGMFVFDELVDADMAVLMSHVNSNPRACLGGKSPLQMLRFIYGDKDTKVLLDAFGIKEICRDELVLKPEILNIERTKRGELPLTKLK